MYTKEQIIERFKKIHGNKYNYTDIVFTKTTDKITILCPEHGYFEQTPHAHLKGQGCPKCGLSKRINSKTSNTKEFIKKAKEVHGEKYDYSIVNYITNKVKIRIICPIHGEFEQTPHGHLFGNGCPKCANQNKGRKENPIKEKKIKKEIKQIENKLYDNNTIKNEIINFILKTNEIIPNNNFDISIKNLRLNFNIISLNDSDNKNYVIKTEECEQNGIQLIHIFEDEWVNKKDICKSRILNLLGHNNRIYARKCKIVEVDKKKAKEFFENNHIQGNVNSKIVYGLEYNGELISAMSFGDLRKNLGSKKTENSYELLRFCNKLNMSVIGGASKLFKHFIKEFNPLEITSYADRRWSMGNLYNELGFNFSHNSEPNYFYVINGERKNRFGYRKDILISKYGCDPNDTERNFCFNKGWNRIYDCGTKVYKWKSTL